jgi:hypothetical protein
MPSSREKALAGSDLVNGTVMLNEAKHLWLSHDFRKDQRFFAALRMTFMETASGPSALIT